MAKDRGDFTEVLIKKGIIGPDQIAEARSLQQQTGMKLADALVKLGYCTPDEVMKAVAEHAGMQSVDLTDATIPATVVEHSLRPHRKRPDWRGSDSARFPSSSASDSANSANPAQRGSVQ